AASPHETATQPPYGALRPSIHFESHARCWPGVIPWGKLDVLQSRPTCSALPYFVCFFYAFPTAPSYSRGAFLPHSSGARSADRLPLLLELHTIESPRLQMRSTSD